MSQSEEAGQVFDEIVAIVDVAGVMNDQQNSESFAAFNDLEEARVGADLIKEYLIKVEVPVTTANYGLATADVLDD